MNATAAYWAIALAQCGVKPSTATRWAAAFEEIVRPEAFSLGWSEIDDFVAQVLHESQMLEHVEENLNYSAKGLAMTWPKRYAHDPKAIDPVPNNLALSLARRPEAIANATYGGRLGNDEPGDGWLYRGRGPIMLTGKAGYEAAQATTGLPLVDKPELAATPRGGLLVAVSWWENNIPDEFIGNTRLVSKRVNGGDIGIKHRLDLAAKTEVFIKGENHA